jgi:uncharacterized protein involved in response to NO
MIEKILIATLIGAIVVAVAALFFSGRTQSWQRWIVTAELVLWILNVAMVAIALALLFSIAGM